MATCVGKDEKVCGTCNYYVARRTQKIRGDEVEVWTLGSTCEHPAISNAQLTGTTPACNKWELWEELYEKPSRDLEDLERIKEHSQKNTHRVTQGQQKHSSVSLFFQTNRRKRGKKAKEEPIITIIAIIIFITIIARACGIDLGSNEKSDETTTVQESDQKAAEINKDEFIFYDSDSRYLTDEDLDGLSKNKLQKAINEIYARRGYIFPKEKNRKYFEKKSWYKGEYEDLDYVVSLFNEYENYNVNLLAVKREELKSKK